MDLASHTEAVPSTSVVILPPDVPTEFVSTRILKVGTPYRLSVCGVPITRKEYYEKAKALPQFSKEHASNVRHTIDRVHKLVSDQIEQMICSTKNPLVAEGIRADCAFNALAWYTFFDPFSHPLRKFVFRSDTLVPIVALHADALYKYGVYVKQLPDQGIYDKLKTMHMDVARHYYDYCAHVTVARMEGWDLSWVTKW